MSTAKEEARGLLDRIPDNATWDDIMYQFYVEKKVEKALQEVKTGSVVPHEEVKKMIQRGLADSDAARTISNDEMSRRISSFRESKRG
jgi:predicted transcriptional regulator